MVIYSGISLKLSRCCPKLPFQTKWRNRDGFLQIRGFAPVSKSRAGRSSLGAREITTSPKGKSRRLRKCSGHVRHGERQEHRLAPRMQQIYFDWAVAGGRNRDFFHNEPSRPPEPNLSLRRFCLPDLAVPILSLRLRRSAFLPVTKVLCLR
jgi:hypothetical protein